MKDKISITDIARHHDISHATVSNYLKAIHEHFIVDKKYYIKHLSFDEFKSVKSCVAKMSFIFTDADNNKVLDIVYNRQLSHLKSYFFTYSKETRDQVQTICIDMYAPYVSLIHSCFPNAKIILGRFPIIQILTRSLNRTDYCHFVCFKYKMTELEVLNELLRSNKELEATYWFYQKLKYIITPKTISQ